jgi:predicted RNase H-like HicB family nuclease
MKIKVILEKGEDGFYSVRCPALRSCWSQGKTRDEALLNIREVIELYLEPNPSELDLASTQEIVEFA